jgi:hypothetical protein
MQPPALPNRTRTRLQRTACFHHKARASQASQTAPNKLFPRSRPSPSSSSSLAAPPLLDWRAAGSVFRAELGSLPLSSVRTSNPYYFFRLPRGVGIASSLVGKNEQPVLLLRHGIFRGLYPLFLSSVVGTNYVPWGISAAFSDEMITVVFPISRAGILSGFVWLGTSSASSSASQVDASGLGIPIGSCSSFSTKF